MYKYFSKKYFKLIELLIFKNYGNLKQYKKLISMETWAKYFNRKSKS